MCTLQDDPLASRVQSIFPLQHRDSICVNSKGTYSSMFDWCQQKAGILMFVVVWVFASLWLFYDAPPTLSQMCWFNRQTFDWSLSDCTKQRLIDCGYAVFTWKNMSLWLDGNKPVILEGTTPTPFNDRVNKSNTLAINLNKHFIVKAIINCLYSFWF